MPAVMAPVPPMADYVLEEPGTRTKAAQVLQARLMGASQFQEVLAMVKDYLQSFDIINMVCALHKCAAAVRDEEALTRRIQGDDNFVILFQRCKETMLAEIDDVTPTTKTIFLWACARLNVFDSVVFTAIVQDATKKLDKYSARGISMLVFALGFIGQRPRASFMGALVRELRTRLSTEFEASAVDQVVYGMYRLGIKDDRLMKLISEHLVNTGLKDTDPLNIVCLTYAYSKLEYWDAEVFSLFSQHAIDAVGNSSTRMAVMLTTAFSEAAQHLGDCAFIVQRLERGMQAEEKLDSLSNRELAAFACALGKFKNFQMDQQREFGETYQRIKPPIQRDESSIAADIQRQVDKRGLEAFTISELSLIVYSIMRHMYRDADFLKDVAEHFALNAPEMCGIEVCNVIYAFARLEFVHIECVRALFAEIKRRDMLHNGELDPLNIATLAYSLSICQISVEWFMDDVSRILCERPRDFTPKVLCMALYALAVVNYRKRAEPVVSAVLEDYLGRSEEFDESGRGMLFWSSALLSGVSSGLWMLEAMFEKKFWQGRLSSQYMTLLYYSYASLRAEAGLNVEELLGWEQAAEYYESKLTSVTSEQNLRLSNRLRIQGVGHEANVIVPVLPGFRPAGVAVDIAIERVKLVIEIEGPKRCIVPLQALLDKVELEEEEAEKERLAEMDADEVMSAEGERSPGMVRKKRSIFGTPQEVVSEARELIECGLSGSAAFKRRLLRKCGWRVVTVSFDENEEYVADALEKMIAPSAEPSNEAGDAEEMIAPGAEDAGDAEVQFDDSDAAQFDDSDVPELGASPVEDINFDDIGPELTLNGLDDGAAVRDTPLSEAEVRLRERHAAAIQELRRRIAQERGDAFASTKYRDAFEYRSWQVRVEQDVLKEMLSEL